MNGRIRRSPSDLTRRSALQAFAAAAGASRSMAQTLAGEPAGRIAPLAELLNVFEVQSMAQRKLPETVYAPIAGTDRRALERITFRPRLMVNVSKLDLSVEILGQTLFTPLIAGPVWRQEAFHPEAELAMVRGASAAKALTIVSQRSSKPLAEIVAAAKTPLWYQVYADADFEATIRSCREAVDAGCSAVCLTVGGGSTTASQTTWEAVDRIRQGIKAPLLLKGIMSPEEARAAVSKGIQAIVVSNHGGLSNGFADPIEMLPEVAEAVDGKIPILIDGSFRRGTDILKALALGARGVLVARPLVWGLAAYGSEGVQAVLEMLQTELARAMAMCGKPAVAAIDRTLVKVHKR